MPELDDYFDYTAGKWMCDKPFHLMLTAKLVHPGASDKVYSYNDTLRHSERRKVFNLSEFKRLAAESVDQTVDKLTSFQKLAEGGFNRTFLITMGDGFQFVARIPFPVTEPKSLLIASEVATMDFLRSHGFPIPKVFGYSPTADNPAGTEYIFMELVTGTNLGDIWFDLSQHEQATIISNLVQLESKLMALRFAASGSVYYCDDLPEKYPRIPIENTGDTPTGNQKSFCIGPDTSFRLWFGKRLDLDVERGPYRDCFAALTTGATKEIAYLEKFGKPLAPFQRLRREVYDYQAQSHLDHIQNLKQYLAIAPSLIPSTENGQYLRRPVFRHPDLQPNNVIVTDNLEVKGLIDWQHSTIQPLFLQAGIPLSIRSHDIIEPLKKPTPPITDDGNVNGSASADGLDSDSNKDKPSTSTQEAELYRRRRLHYEYIKQTAEKNPEHYDALSERFNKLRRRLWHHAGDPWEGDVITLKVDLIDLSRRWADLTGDNGLDCPISFSDEEIEDCLRLSDAQAEADEQLQECQEIVGVGSEGWTPVASYDKVKAREKNLRKQAFEAAESEEERRRLEQNWIFDDFDEDDYT